MADTVTTEEKNEALAELKLIGAALGVAPPQGVPYTPEFGRLVVDKLQAAYAQELNQIPSVRVDRDDIAEAKVFAKMSDTLSAKGIGGVDANMVGALVGNLAHTIEFLDDNGLVVADTPTLETPQSAPAQSPASSVATEIKMVPVEDVPADIRERMQRVEQALVDFIPIINSLPKKLVGEPLPVVAKADGLLDQQSMTAFSALLDKTGSTKSGGYTPALGMEIAPKLDGYISGGIAALGAQAKMQSVFGDVDPKLEHSIAVLNGMKTNGTVSTLMADLNYLHEKGFLKPVELKEEAVQVAHSSASNPIENADRDTVLVGQQGSDTVPEQAAPKTADVTPEVSASTAAQTSMPVDNVKNAVDVVERTLFDIGGSLIGKGGMIDLPDMGEGINLSGMVDTVVQPLTQADLDDGVFGQRSQDLTAKAIMGLRMMAGDEAPNGYYDEEVGKKLKFAILTKPELSMVREKMGVDKVYTPEEAEALLAPFAGKKLEPLADDASDVEMAAYSEKKKIFAAQAAEYQEQQMSIIGVTTFFDQLNILKKNDMLLDDQKAKQTNTINLFLDAASGFLGGDQSGFMGMLKNFFTNNQFGKMIGNMLMGFMGINVARLWGDKEDSNAVEKAIKDTADDFESSIKKAQEADPSLTVQAAISKNKEAFLGNMDSFFPRNTLRLALGSNDAGMMRAAVEDAFTKAEGQPDLASAKATFTETLTHIGTAYKNGQSVTINGQVYTGSGQTPEQLQNRVNDADKMLHPFISGGDGQVQVPGGDGNDPLTAFSDPAVDIEIIEAGKQNVGFIYTPKTDFVQGPMRYSYGRVDDMQEVLTKNHDALELSFDANMMKSRNGRLSDMFTPNTSAVIEETLIRAQVHALTKSGVEITQAHLDGFSHKLSAANLGVVQTYMADQGVSQADIDAFSRPVIEMDADLYSTDPKDKAAGAVQANSVLAQSLYGDQLSLRLADWVPSANTTPVSPSNNADPLEKEYLDYNKNRPCEVPKFFTKEGSDSVFALIRDKKGDQDPSNDEFKVLELEGYLKKFRIQDDADLKALQDNYNWGNSSEYGIRNHINKVLCIEPPKVTMNVPPVVQAAQQQTVHQYSAPPSQPHKVPETFKDLRELTPQQRQSLEESLGLYDNQKLMNTAHEYKMSPLAVLFDGSLSQKNPSNFTVLELDAHGKHHPQFDAVVAIREGNTIDFRYIKYDEDYIKPISEQREARDIFDTRNQPDRRRLDDFLDEIQRKPGGQIVQGAIGGYSAMNAIIPDENGRLIYAPGLRAVYGVGVEADGRYNDTWQERYATRSGHEVMVRDHDQRNATLAERQELDRRTIEGDLPTPARNHYVPGHQQIEQQPNSSCNSGFFSWLANGHHNCIPIEANAGDMGVGHNGNEPQQIRHEDMGYVPMDRTAGSLPVYR